MHVRCFRSSDSGRCPRRCNPAHSRLQSLSTSSFSSSPCGSLPCAELQTHEPGWRHLGGVCTVLQQTAKMQGMQSAGKRRLPAQHSRATGEQAAPARVSQVSWWVKSVRFCGWSTGQHSRGAELVLHLSPASSASWSVYSHTRDLEESAESCSLSNPADCRVD